MPKRPAHTTEDPAASEIQRLAGKRLRAIRAMGGIKQEDIAELIGVDQSTWSKWETGKREPDLFTVLRFAIRAKTSLDFIYRGRLEGTHPALAKLLRLRHPELVVEEPSDTDASTDKALESYRSAIHLPKGE